MTTAYGDGDPTRLLALVRAQTADIMGIDCAEDVDPETTFADLGFESMAMTELSSALARATGLELPVTLGFDHPTPAALARYMARALGGVQQEATPPRPAEAGEDDPIVIVGMSCRFPGRVRSPEELFALTARGIDAVGPFPTDRGWPLDRLFDPDPAHPHTCTIHEGGFLDDIDAFDAAFFGIGPREATAMDPQHRLLLESAWEAFEDARVDPATVRATAAGVFVGLATHDYYGARASAVPPDLERHFVLGNAPSLASGRIAYTFGLEGPAVTVDTACSSSLVALHLACSAIRQGECTMALAGGVSVYTTPETFVTFSRQRTVSADGRCKAFGATADGTGFAEGVGFVLVERRSEARRRGHRELAVVRGSATNQDGASNGITAPNGPSQERVIRRALADARLVALDVDAVEAHGTGTKLGDPIEAGALLATYGAGRPAERPLWLGSMKSNMGHAQAAAGIGAIIKMVMAMRHGLLPATLHVDAPSPHVDWSAGSVRLLGTAVEWPRAGRPRRAGVSGFGISGTNAHVILEEACPPQAPAPRAPTARPPVTSWVVSARTTSALRAQAARLLEHLDRRPDLRPLDVAHSLVATRTAHEHRAVVLGRERGELLAGLQALAADADAPNVVRGEAASRGPIAFVFAGQGTHWAGMARELRATSPVFAASLQRVSAALAPHLDWSLDAVLADEPGAPSLSRAEVVQPALFAMMVSLAALWRSFGVEPAIVIGHSQGEVAAAHVAGALSLDDAARLAVYRSRTLARLAGRGGMLSLSLPVDDVRRRLERWGDRLSVAAINGPASVVVTGDTRALAELLAEAEHEGVWARSLPADVPAHSPLVDELRERLLAELGDLAPCTTDVGFASAVTGAMHDSAGLDAEYWFANLRSTVRFADAVLAAAAHGCRTFVEISPHPVLTYGLAGTLESAAVDPEDVAITSSLRRDDGGMRRFATSVAALHARGQPIDWKPLLGPDAQAVDLPTYAFDRSRFWLDAVAAGGRNPAAAGLRPIDHPLLGAGVQLAGREEQLFTGRVALAADAWVADHAVMDNVVLPGTAFVELALRAAREVGCDGVDELTLEAPLVLRDDDGAAQLQLRVGEPDDAGRRSVTIAARPERDDAAQDEPLAWTQHASGTLAPAAAQDAELDAGGLAAWPPAGTELDVEDLYDRLRRQGVGYGPVFRGLRAAWRTGDAVFAEVGLDDEAARAAADFEIHPALFDAAFHAMGERLLDAAPGQAWLPFSWRGVRVHRQGASSVRARLTPAGDGLRLVATDELGAPVVIVDSVVLRQITTAQLAAATSGQDGLSVIDWRPCAPGSGIPVRVVVLGDDIAGLHAERHADVDALGASLAGASASAPVVALVPGARADAAGDLDLATGARQATHRALELLQRWLADDRLGDARLAFLTRGGVSTAAGEAPDPVAAAVWGLARAARTEHPDRVLLLDADDAPASGAALTAALSTDEPELAIRDGRLLAPRLVSAPAPSGSEHRLDPGGTVLVTGGTTGLGARCARHLVSAHGVRHLLLVSRRGADAPQAAGLRAELTALGADVTVAACDVGDRAALARLLAQIPAAHPLTGVVHSAGVLDDGVITSLTPERMDRALRPKADAAAHLDALTEGLDLGAFVLFSSIAGTFGSAAQGNYAAANAFLDALAQRRRARGLAGVSIAWGLWETTEIVSHLDETDFARLARIGVTALSGEAGLGLLDAALELDRPLVVAARLDLGALRAQSRTGMVTALLRSKAGTSTRRRTARGESLARHLGGLAAEDRPAVVLDLVREHAAVILGHDAPTQIEPQRAFKDLGLDSIGAVELRNRLGDATELRLSSTMVFDHPSPAAVAAHLLGLMPDTPARSPVDEHVDRLEALLGAVGDDQRDGVRARLRGLLDVLGPAPAPAPPASLEPVDTAERLRAADVDELLELIDRDLQER